ncbi:MAG: N-acetylornithine carbamoyltransferase [Thermoplasmata archaeon]|nr:N-acetylornithine carbamoyltransferase [Thermoplasmata archaeon]RLF29396.1 MAG: N-acetylornithine carbamoyltransferase [Thermoplasmata archaeon]
MLVNTTGSSLRGRDLITLMDLTREEIDFILDVAFDLKRRMAIGDMPRVLDRKTLFMMFYNRSLRTRNSFEAGMTQLGGHAHDLSPSAVYAPALPGEEQAYTTERIADVARVLSQMGDGIAIRIYGKPTGWVVGKGDLIIREFAKWATVPVLNMEDDLYHPHQALADVMTMKEKLRNLEGKKFVMSWAYSGSPEKPLAVPQSAIIAASFFGMDITLAYPEGFDLRPEVIEFVKKNVDQYGGSFEIVHDMKEAFEGADVVYPKSWTAGRLLPQYPAIPGYGSETAQWDKIKELFEKNKHWRTTQELMDLTNRAIYMHCLPADRGQEVDDEVIDAPYSVVWDEAGNRLHAQKAVLALLLR